jgi:hypothetical protein
MVSLSVVSLMAIVPDKECNTPTLMVSAASAIFDIATAPVKAAYFQKLFLSISSSFCLITLLIGPNN